MLTRILIVDDEAPMVELLRRYLEPLASYIESTDDLREAMEVAQHRKFNVVILDLLLKGTGKAEAFVAIREFKRHDSAVVVVSGLPEPHLKEDALAAGADSFVAKGEGFGPMAMLIATNVATLKLPATSYRSDSYLQHVEMLHKMVHDGHPIAGYDSAA